MISTDRLRFFAHKGKQILLVNFTNCTPEEVQSLLDGTRQVITGQPQHSVLVLADFTGAQFSRDAVSRLKEVATYDRPYVKRAAWVHADGLPKVFYDGVKAFSQREFPTFVISLTPSPVASRIPDHLTAPIYK